MSEGGWLAGDVEAELDDVAVADDVFFAFEADVAVLAGGFMEQLSLICWMGHLVCSRQLTPLRGKAR